MNIMPDIRWHNNMIGPPKGTLLDLAFVRDNHLRVVNGTVDDSYITQLLDVAEMYGQRLSWRAFREQTWQMVVDAVPADGLVYLLHPPIAWVESITADDVPVDLATVDIVLPRGPLAGFGRVTFDPIPSGRVVIQYVAGYTAVEGTSPPNKPNEVPYELIHGMLLVIGELYRTRSLSVQGTVQFPGMVQARDIFTSYRPY